MENTPAQTLASDARNSLNQMVFNMKQAEKFAETSENTKLFLEQLGRGKWTMANGSTVLVKEMDDIHLQNSFNLFKKQLADADDAVDLIIQRLSQDRRSFSSCATLIADVAQRQSKSEAVLAVLAFEFKRRVKDRRVPIDTRSITLESLEQEAYEELKVESKTPPAVQVSEPFQETN